MITLKYRKLAFYFYRLLVFGSLGFILFNVLLNIGPLTQGDWLKPAIRLLISSAFSLTILYRALFYFRPRIRSLYHLAEDHLVIEKGRVKKTIEFNQISKISFTLLPPRFMGGFRLHLKSGQNFLFLSLLEKNEKIIEHIYFYNPLLISEAKKKKYIQVSLCVSESWRRMHKSFKSTEFYIGFCFWLIGTFVTCFFTLPYSGELFILLYSLILLALFLLFLPIYSIFDTRLNKKEYQLYLESGELVANEELEKKTGRIIFYLFLTLITVVLAGLFSLNMISY